jgi:hypothetical protein
MQRIAWERPFVSKKFIYRSLGWAFLWQVSHPCRVPPVWLVAARTSVVPAQAWSYSSPIQTQSTCHPHP